MALGEIDQSGLASQISAAYTERWEQRGDDQRYALSNPAQLFLRQARERAILDLLRSAGLIEALPRLRILDVGCGHGQWLADFEAWGAQRANLAGIDVLPGRAARAQARLCGQRDDEGAVVCPGADIRHGEAGDLPWPEGSFDLVVQSMMFSSVIDRAARWRIAGEMSRALAPGGVVLSYDFFLPSPGNRHVRPLGRRELVELFPGFAVTGRRITLAPPFARRLVPRARPLAALLEALRVLDSHYLALLRKPAPA